METCTQVLIHRSTALFILQRVHLSLQSSSRTTRRQTSVLDVMEAICQFRSRPVMQDILETRPCWKHHEFQRGYYVWEPGFRCREISCDLTCRILTNRLHAYTPGSSKFA